jgi:hypothetical protein
MKKWEDPVRDCSLLQDAVTGWPVTVEGTDENTQGSRIQDSNREYKTGRSALVFIM